MTDETQAVEATPAAEAAAPEGRGQQRRGGTGLDAPPRAQAT
jgi:hypothetical protein